MLLKFKLLLLFCLIAVISFYSQAQTPDLTGTWKLNFEKSQLEHRAEGLTGSTFIIIQKGNKIKLTRYHYFGSKKKRIRFSMIADGKIRRVKLLFKGKLETHGQALQSTLVRKHFWNCVTYRFGSSEKELVADEVFKGLPQDHHNIWVFDKQ